MDSSNHALEIPVNYKGQELVLPAIFIQSGYTHKIQVTVQDLLIMFEPDEEGNYRVILNATQLEKNANLDIALLEAIAVILGNAVRNK